MTVVNEFKIGEYIVYPVHGIGKITGIETQKYFDFELNVYVISFDNDRMTLSVPMNKAQSVGMRHLCSAVTINKVIDTLGTQAIIRKSIWSRRAQEYEAKINSGNPIAIAEVARDLYRRADQAEQSYSERQLFRSAFDRLIYELSLVESIAPSVAEQKLTNVLAKIA